MNLFDLLRRRVGALQRSGIRQLQADVDVALVFFGQERAGSFLPKNRRRHANANKQECRDQRFCG